MERVLISACLLGRPVRYDGGSKLRADPILSRWQAEGRLVSCCPEVDGGLPVPRPAAEVSPTDHLKVVAIDGTDVTGPFVRGAQAALATARRYDIKVAVFKDASPSCGSTRIYDGTFTGRLVAGSGVTTRLLERHGVRVFGEDALDEAAAYLATLET
ncbi:MAG TPA: DUF523 domain-containing protein [Streptosporangiaceae bacterium]|nr:DUF523 domain-containing protein [Streptosporangiaceae bacterium]